MDVLDTRTTTGGAPSPEAPKPKKNRNKIVAAAAAVALVAGGAAAVAALNSGEKAPAAPQTSEPIPPVDTVDPGEVEPPVEQPTGPWYETMNVDPSSNEIILSTNDVTPEQLPEAFTNTMTVWLNSGYSADFANTMFESDDFEADVNERAADYDKLFKKSLIAEDSTGEVNDYFDRTVLAHQNDLYFSSYTSFPDDVAEDVEPYMRQIEVVSVEDLTVAEDGTVEFTAETQDSDNSDLNRVGEDLSGGTALNTDVQSAHYTFVVEDGTYKLADFRT